jgi:AcrR family transcriptional regulator
MSAQEPGEAGASWRDVAVARVLDPARARAEKRVQRFLDAALELMTSSSGKEFTVQEVVERSGQSLRSFYQYFDGKYELLLALFEDSVRTVAAQLQEEISDESSAAERLHRFIVEYFHHCQPGLKGRTTKRGFAPAFASFSHQLLTEHPVEAARAFQPLASMLEDLLKAAADDGAIRSGLDHDRLAGTILQAIMFNAFAATISGVPAHPADVDPGEELWDLLINGMGK